MKNDKHRPKIPDLGQAQECSGVKVLRLHHNLPPSNLVIVGKNYTININTPKIS